MLSSRYSARPWPSSTAGFLAAGFFAVGLGAALGLALAAVREIVQFLGLGRDVFAGDFELPHQFPGLAGFAETVLDADGAERDRVTVQLRCYVQCMRYPVGEAADLVFLGRHDDAGLERRLHERRRH